MNILAHKISGIYKITNLVNGHCYVGSAANIKQRWAQHISALRLNKHHSIYLQRAWNKYGENNFSFSIAEECEKNSLLQREQYHIDNSCSEYNILKFAGSPLGVKHSEESKKKNADAHMGNQYAAEYMRSEEAREKYSKIHKGKIVSKETRMKQSIAKIGRILSEKVKENMRASVKRGEENNMSKLTSLQVEEIRKRYIPRVVSQRDLAKEYGVDQQVIWSIVNYKTWRPFK